MTTVRSDVVDLSGGVFPIVRIAMNFKALALGSIFAASTAMPASFAHALPVAHFSPHTTASALACGDDEYFEDGGFSRMIHNPQGTFYSGGSPDGSSGIGFAISGQNIVTAQWQSTTTGDPSPFGLWYYTTNGSDLNRGSASFNPVIGRNGVLNWSFNSHLVSMPSGARVVVVVMGDFGGSDLAFGDTAFHIIANGAASVPVPGVETDNDACFLLDD